MSIGFIISGFILFYMYDINSVTFKIPLINTFFFIGSGLIVSGSAVLIYRQINTISWGGSTAVWALGFVGSLALLIYTLFFALPFSNTYQNETANTICDTGMYALCRHPGVLWFFTTFLCLCGVFFSCETFLVFLVANAMNLAYIILQDYWIFPKLFQGYSTYKENTPFLIPTKNSIRTCFKTMRGYHHDI